MIVLPIMFLLVPVLSKYKTELSTTKAPVSTLRAMPWRLSDSLSLCPYRFESYMSRKKRDFLH